MVARLAALLLLAACAAPPEPDPRLAAQLERAAHLKATEQRLDLALTRVERDAARLTVHNWATVTTEQPDGPRQVCIDCGRTR